MFHNLVTIVVVLLMASCSLSFRASRVEAQKPHQDSIEEVSHDAEVQARAELEKAKASGDRIAILTAELNYLKAQKTIALEKIERLKYSIRDKDRAIDAERQRVLKVKFYWLAGICAFLAVMAVGLGIWFRLKYAFTFAAASVSVAATAYFVAWLIPYLIYVGIGIAIIGLAAFVIYWFRDHKTAKAVIAAVEPIKSYIPNYREHFRKFSDGWIDSRVDQLRLPLSRKAPWPHR